MTGPSEPRTLADLRIAESACVRQLVGSPAITQRLAEMGLTTGSVVRVVRVAPLGDPVQITVRSYQLSLRRSEMRCVIVDPAPCPAPGA
jgi:ferrous iron transport protein A